MRSSDAGALEPWPRRRQNFSDKVLAREKAPASIASRAASKAADAVVLSTPVINCTTRFWPVRSGFPMGRRIFARHLPGSRSNARTTNLLYSMRALIRNIDGTGVGHRSSRRLSANGRNCGVIEETFVRRRVRREVADGEISPELSQLLPGLARLLGLRRCNEFFPLLGHSVPELAIAFSRGLFHILARPLNFHLKSFKRQ